MRRFWPDRFEWFFLALIAAGVVLMILVLLGMLAAPDPGGPNGQPSG